MRVELKKDYIVRGVRLSAGAIIDDEVLGPSLVAVGAAEVVKPKTRKSRTEKE